MFLSLASSSGLIVFSVCLFWQYIRLNHRFNNSNYLLLQIKKPPRQRGCEQRHIKGLCTSAGVENIVLMKQFMRSADVARRFYPAGKEIMWSSNREMFFSSWDSREAKIESVIQCNFRRFSSPCRSLSTLMIGICFFARALTVLGSARELIVLATSSC